MDVVAKLSPEEIEEGKLSDRYQSIAEQQKKGKCTGEVIELYKSDVIPRAEKSAFNVPKNKFLFLANRDIGNCYLAQQNFVEAEAAFRKILQYAPVWPGTDDSAYPINFRQIADAVTVDHRLLSLVHPKFDPCLLHSPDSDRPPTRLAKNE